MESGLINNTSFFLIQNEEKTLEQTASVCIIRVLKWKKTAHVHSKEIKLAWYIVLQLSLSHRCAVFIAGNTGKQACHILRKVQVALTQH